MHVQDSMFLLSTTRLERPFPYALTPFENTKIPSYKVQYGRPRRVQRPSWTTAANTPTTLKQIKKTIPPYKVQHGRLRRVQRPCWTTAANTPIHASTLTDRPKPIGKGHTVERTPNNDRQTSSRLWMVNALASAISPQPQRTQNVEQSTDLPTAGISSEPPKHSPSPLRAVWSPLRLAKKALGLILSFTAMK